MTTLEVCVDSVESAIAAEAGGAQRIELCSALIEGGLTPSLGLIRRVRERVSLDVHVLIRPRGGDFLYSDEELAVMREDIRLAAESGVEGVVFGLLTATGDVDVSRTRDLVIVARPMQVTFHRAIDMARDVEVALEALILTGADRVLTSGGEPTALQGRMRLSRLVSASQGRIHVMVGGGVRPVNARQIAQTTKALEYHASLRVSAPSPVQPASRRIHLGDPGVDDYARTVVLPEDVRSLQQALRAAFATDTAVAESSLV